MNWHEFLAWERADRQRVDFKVAYVDVAGDLISGLLLSQIVYWHLPSKDGNSKLRVSKDGRMWLAKGREEWWGECRLTPKQVDRALDILQKKGLIECHLFKFNGSPTIHIHLLQDALLTQMVNSILPKSENGFSPNGKMDIDLSVKSLTETTTETTTSLEVSGETSVEATPQRRRRTPKPKIPTGDDSSTAEKSAIEEIMPAGEWKSRKWELGELFSEKTKLPVPKGQWGILNRRWWTPLEEIVVAAGDMDTAKEVVEKAIDLHIEKRYQLSAPQSILNTAISFAGEIKRGSQSTGGWRQG